MLRRAFNAFLRLVLACAHERRGQVALTFGLSVLPALIMVGSAIDYSRAVTQRSNLQQATDSTVLAMAHTYLTASATCTSLYGPTQTYLTGTMNTPAAAGLSQAGVATACAGAGAITVTGATGVATLQSVIISQNNTQMCIRATMAIPTQMMTIVHINTMTVGAYSCSQIGGTYEVALVLDNSYSMSESLGSQTKMQALQTAALNLVNTLIPSGTMSPTTSISIVPFNALVNVGPANANASFMDTTGQSSLNWRIIGKPSWAKSRFDLFTALQANNSGSGVAWGGCVEERPNNLNSSFAGAPDTLNYLTTDKAATVGDSLFVPYFAPDDPGTLNNTTYNWYNAFSNNYESYNDCDNSPYGSASGNCGSNKTSYTFSNSYLNDAGYQGWQQSGLNNTCTSSDWTNDLKNTNKYPGSGITLACKYKNATSTITTTKTNPPSQQWFGLSVGPNSNCTTPAVTPLTTDTYALTTAIKAMAPTGLTNLATGFMWGWRTISPIVNPFPTTNTAPIGQQNPKTYNYSPPKNTKVIILMTDGYNTWSPYILTGQFQGYNWNISNPFISAYETFGYMTENRLSNYSTTPPASNATAANTGSYIQTNAAGFRAQMDNVLLEACTNAKNAQQKIVIYTVGFTIDSDPIDQEGINVLQACASASANYYQASDGAGINSAFQQIAASITNLRLTQ